MDRLTYDGFKAMVMDPSVPDEAIADYLTVDPTAGGAFDPRVVPDASKVTLGAEGRFDTESGLRWANAVSRWRRQQRFQERLPGSQLPVLVSEGDSWFQFPFLIRDIVDQLAEDHLIWSLDAAGDSAENMVHRRPEYMKGLQEQQVNGVAAFLFSAAGNDVIGEDPLGNSVLTALVKDHEPGKSAAWHVDQASLSRTLTFLEGAYRKVVATVRSEPAFTHLPILIHAYDYAIPGGHAGDPRRAAWASQGKWLGDPLRAKGILDPALQQAILRILIDATYDVFDRIAGDSAATRVYLVDIRGALPDINDWADEIHATDAGFGRVADRFRDTLRDAGVGRA